MNANGRESEGKVVYREEGDKLRVLRGKIVSLEEGFVTVERMDGIHKIAVKDVVEVHYPKEVDL